MLKGHQDSLELLDSEHYSNIFKKYLWNEASIKDLEELKSDPKRFEKIKNFSNRLLRKGYLNKYENIIKKADINMSQFYRDAEKRNEILIQNLTSKKFKKSKITAIILGGYHTEGVKNILRNKGISYEVIIPNVSNVKSKNYYLDRISEQANWLLNKNSLNIFKDKISNKNFELEKKLQLVSIFYNNQFEQNLPLKIQVLCKTALSLIDENKKDLVIQKYLSKLFVELVETKDMKLSNEEKQILIDFIIETMRDSNKARKILIQNKNEKLVEIFELILTEKEKYNKETFIKNSIESKDISQKINLLLEIENKINFFENFELSDEELLEFSLKKEFNFLTKYEKLLIISAKIKELKIKIDAEMYENKIVEIGTRELLDKMCFYNMKIVTSDVLTISCLGGKLFFQMLFLFFKKELEGIKNLDRPKRILNLVSNDCYEGVFLRIGFNHILFKDRGSIGLIGILTMVDKIYNRMEIPIPQKVSVFPSIQKQDNAIFYYHTKGFDMFLDRLELNNNILSILGYILNIPKDKVIEEIKRIINKHEDEELLVHDLFKIKNFDEESILEIKNKFKDLIDDKIINFYIEKIKSEKNINKSRELGAHYYTILNSSTIGIELCIDAFIQDYNKWFISKYHTIESESAMMDEFLMRRISILNKNPYDLLKLDQEKLGKFEESEFYYLVLESENLEKLKFFINAISVNNLELLINTISINKFVEIFNSFNNLSGIDASEEAIYFINFVDVKIIVNIIDKFGSNIFIFLINCLNVYNLKLILCNENFKLEDINVILNNLKCDRETLQSFHLALQHFASNKISYNQFLFSPIKQENQGRIIIDSKDKLLDAMDKAFKYEKNPYMINTLMLRVVVMG